MQNLEILENIHVYTPNSPEFKRYENQIKLIYESAQERITDTNTFDFVRDNTLFYMFVYKSDLVGGIYYFAEGGKLYMNGFSRRKMYPVNVECVKLSTKWFNCDIHAPAQNRASALCLIKSGFKREEGNLYKFVHPKTPIFPLNL